MDFKKVIVISTMIFIGVLGFSQAAVKAEIPSGEYSVGELVEVNIDISNNPGIHGGYFDLIYDSSIFEFDDVVKSTLISNETNLNELMYAVSEKNNSHVIVSYTLKGNNTAVSADGQLLKLWFRVKNQGIQGAKYKFSFNNTGLIDATGNPITNVIWQDSREITITNPYTGTFILIKEPYENQVFYKDEVDINLICSTGNYTVRLSNEDNSSFNAVIKNVTTGVLLNEKVELVYGFNRILARLYDNNDNLLCKDTVKVYRSTEDKFVKIASPYDHSLLNTDMTEVIVHSPYDNVQVNGINATYNGEIISDTHAKVYKVKLWLKQGFNIITAEAKSPENVIYKDSIQVYYQKDPSIFNFILPRQDESFKPAAGAKMYIKGEIDSLYKTGDDPKTGGPVENTVTLKVIYRPASKVLDQRILVNNSLAKIIESDFSYESAKGKYVFYNDFDISLADLDDGEIEIIAYKNKENDVWDNEIHRIVYIDNNRLWIDLVQPNVFTQDILDTYQKIIDFNEGKEIVSDGNIEVNNEGAIILKSTERIVKDEGLKNAADIIEREDGTSYALVNDINNGIMRIYKKGYGDNSWIQIVTKTGLFGYKLCDVDLGIMVGVSHLFSNTGSGLYLLRDNNLINIDFGEEDIPHVQFIENHNGKIYIYGNFYQYLYSFNTYSLEESENKLVVTTLNKTNFLNTYKIKDFILTSNGNTIAIRTDNDEIMFYKKEAENFNTVSMPQLNGTSSITGKYILCGEYENGDYNVYIVVKDNINMEVIMENKKNSSYLRISRNIGDLLNEKADPAALKGVGFEDNSFIFLYLKGSDYFVKRGKVFFDKFYPDDSGEMESYQFGSISISNFKLMIKKNKSIYFGIGDLINQVNLYSFNNKFKDNGSYEFNYVNDDIDGLTGFEFEVDPVWLLTDGIIEFEYKLKEKAGIQTSPADNTIFGLDRISLKQLIESASTNTFYKLHHNYDAGINREIIHIEFNELQKNKYLAFKIYLKSLSNSSPAIYNLKVFKKIRVKICAEEGKNVTLPIHGYVYDRTVKSVNIQHIKVELERDQGFYYDLILNTEQKTIPIEISCQNGAAETASINFTVEIVDSKNNVWDALYKRVEDAEYLALTPGGDEFIVNTVKDKISLQGKYFGLAGCFVGYEIYSYDEENNGELKLEKRDVFNLVRNNSVYDLSTLGSGYEAGYFSRENIELLPGRQRLVIYCENPGGLRIEYKAAGKYPDIMYNMPASEQEIVFYLDALSPNENVSNVIIKNKLNLEAYENENNSYKFNREYEISGWIKSLFKFDKLNVKSLTSGLTFENGQSQMNIEVDEGNRFKIKFNAELADMDFVKNFYIDVCPVNPAFTTLEKGFKVTVKKSYQNTNYIPDFSEIHPDKWTTEQKNSLIIPVKLKFNRNDVPTQLTTLDKGYIEANLIVNYEHTLKGIIYEKDGYYYMKDSVGNSRDCSLQGDMIKEGINRIQWSLIFKDFIDKPVEGTPYQMSYSSSGKPGMEDYIFEYYDSIPLVPTDIVFNPGLTENYYASATLPGMNITKDKRTILSMSLNENNISLSTLDFTSKTLGYNELKNAIKEGKNEIVIRYTEPAKSETVKTYTFMFDNADPVVNIESYKFSADYLTLLEITASVEEANYSEGFLYYGAGIVNKLPEIIIKSSDKYQLVWKDLALENITPSTLLPVKVGVNDLAGKYNESSQLTGFENIERPAETDIREIKVELPEYNGSPVVSNETNYTSRDFPGHTKLAPEKFIKRVSIRDEVKGSGNYLIKSGKVEKADPIYWSRCESESNIMNPEIFTTQVTKVLGGIGPSISSVTGKFGQATYFYGSSGGESGHNVKYTLVENHNLTKMTASFWLNQSGIDWTSFWVGNIRFVINRYNRTLTVYLNNETEIANVPDGMIDLSWNHIYITVDTNKTDKVKMYINGSLKYTYSGNGLINFNNSSTYISINGAAEANPFHTKIDNIKIWDYVVSEDPTTINNIGNTENFRTTEDFLKPTYWSKCESILNITTSPDIGEGNGIQSGLHEGIGAGKFINAIYDQSSQEYNNGYYGSWYPQGDNFNLSNKGSMSFWMKNEIGMHGFYLMMGAFYIKWVNWDEPSGIFIGPAPGKFYSCNNVDLTWHLMYLIWDKDGFEDGNTVKLYKDGVLIIQNNSNLSNWNAYDKFRFRWYDNTDEQNSKILLDNVKYWNHVISEDPAWLTTIEGSEDYFSPATGDKGPVYWSKCENNDNLINAEITSGTTPTISTDLLTGTGKFGNCVYYAVHWDDPRLYNYINFNPFGNTPHDFSKGTLSVWIKIQSNYNDDPIGRWGFGDSNLLRVYLNKDINVPNTVNLTVNGTTRTVNTSFGSWQHLYMVWDSDKKLSGGNSVKVFLNGVELSNLSTSDNLSENLSNIVFKNDWLLSTILDKSLSVSMDNIIIWDYVISEDPSYIAESETNSSLPENYGKYLIFKIAKDPFVNNINTKDDITDQIKFEFVGKKWDTLQNKAIEVTQLPDGTPSTITNPITIEEENLKYIEGTNHIYYMVNSNVLKDKFTAIKDLMTSSGKPLDPNGELVIIDPGSLRIKFNENWTNFYPTDIYLEGKQDDNGSIYHSWNDIIVYDTGYESYSTVGEETLLHPDIRYPKYESDTSITDRSFVHDNLSEAMTISFWTRLEDEGILESMYSAKDKRLFTFCDTNNTELINLSYRSNKLIFIDRINPFVEIATLPVEGNPWYMITLCIDKENNQLKLYINNLFAMTITNLDPIVIEKILQKDAKYYFGASDNEEFNSGFSSISLPFYINRLLTLDEIQRLYNLYDKNTGGDITNSFTDQNSVFGSRNSDLHKIGGNDFFEMEENADYTETLEHGSFKTSNAHKNLLTVKNLDIDKNCIILKNASTYITNNINVNSYAASFELVPTNSKGGRYYFGDKTGNYGLGKDRWYSVSGTVEDIASGAEATLVLRINGEEQGIKLQKGYFHFVYDNANNLTPSDVKLYIETKGNIRLSTEMSLNEGNYTLKKSLEKSAGSTMFPFDLTGTVSFWYKPIMSNKDGFVNYNAVIFDSEYIKIEARAQNNNEDAVYYAYIKKEDGSVDIELPTKVKLNHRWQFIQLSYSCDKKVVYLYIDGDVAAKSEGAALPVYGSLLGINPTKDNVYLGCDEDQNYFAEGYIDDFLISKYYFENKYSDNKPADITYNGTLSVNLNYNTINGIVITEDKVTGLKYRLESLDKDYYEEGTGFPISLAGNKPSGRYRLTTEMKVNGHNYKEILGFNIDNKPKFNLADKTPIVFSSNMLNSVKFKFKYDNSYQFKKEDLVYAGLAIKIKYNTNESKIMYLTQDHLSQDYSKWIIGVENQGSIDWQDTLQDNAGNLVLNFADIITDTKVDFEIKYFYIKTSFNDGNKFDNITEIDQQSSIEIASIHYEIKKYEVEEKDGTGNIVKTLYEYMLEINIIDENNQNTGDLSSIVENIGIGYSIRNIDNVILRSGDKKLDNNGAAKLFYDDILPGYGEYKCDLTLKYNNNEYANVNNIALIWKEKKGLPEEIKVTSKLEIEEFSILYIDKKTDRANLLLKYYVNEIGEITSTVDVIQDGRICSTQERPLLNMSGSNNEFYENISIPKGYSVIKITLRAEGFMCSQEINVNNYIGAPDIVLTNWVESTIPYNNVYFSWKGYYEGKFNEDIEYTYNFDNTGWSTPNKEWRSVRFYNLPEGYHTFEVKAVYNEIESSIRAVKFFVDINRPLFNIELITVEKIYDAGGVLYAVIIRGKEEAIIDASLRELYVNSYKINFSDDGSFVTDKIILTKDGENKIVFTAVDRVGNFTDYTVVVENNITQVVFPNLTQNIKYCPMVIVGKINDLIDAKMKIYVKDPFCTDKETGNYTGWKEAKINADRTFFIEDVYVNPGTASQEILTTLILKSVFESGREFEREINVYANEIVLPIEMKLSTHASEGENADTYVEIDCKANVDFISNWSIDYNGDGVYDDIKLIDNPYSESAKTYKWSHKYSSLGIVKPRVRVITTDGNFFSVSDTLIIHEKIKEASNKLIKKPISISSVSMPDNSKRLFVLQDISQTAAAEYAVDVYEVGRNETYISNKLFTINITQLGIVDPVKIRALDKDHLFIASNTQINGIVYELKANDFGNYEINKTLNLTNKINDIANDKYSLFVSYVDVKTITKVSIIDNIIDVLNPVTFTPEITNSTEISANTGITKDAMGLLIADYYNQRIVRISNALKINDQFGNIGLGEGEFLKPSIVKSYENRIFVYDEGRHDIQVFDQNFKTICKLEFSTNPEYFNYLEPEFFNEIEDLEIIAKVENSLLYYYALILSKSSKKLAMLRLPQWEELRARVRNNKIVFVQDGEIFTAKPDGSDLTKILSSDSIPRIEGNVDYPALSPDGKSLAFTSRLRLYNGETGGETNNNGEAYDAVYVYDIETKVLKRIDLDAINGYEIERPVFNSNGDRLIFSAKETGKKWQIYVYNFETKAITKLFNSDENARFPYYSPDDRFVVFTTDYDGNEEIEIIDTQNTSIRVSVTNNYARDSLPVWNTVYPFEILNQDLKIESKISFVSERNFHKGIYYVYLSRKSDSDIRVVKKTGEDIGNNPDSAAIEVTTAQAEGDYPCFTGDGMNLVFQYFDGNKEILKKYDYQTALLTNMELPGSTRKPAGMKNMIANFKAENKNGDEIALTWDRYTVNDIFYIVRFKKNAANEAYVEKKIFSQNGSLLQGLEMGQEYIVKVCIIENEEEVATSQWKKVKMPDVVARPTFEIDTDNPYLVNLHAWKPKPETEWNFSWIIDNNEINVSTSQDYTYEFATSGIKNISLKASNKGNTATNYSKPMEVNIISDIKPVIEYVLAEDSSYVELNAENSIGEKIDYSTVIWTITGPGRDQVQYTGSKVIVQLNGFLHKINVNMTMKRIAVNGQNATDTINKNMTIDLDFKEVKPVITYSVDEKNKRLLRFSGEQSKGNIDWIRTKWTLYANNGIIYTTEGVSTFDYLFPETNENTVYSLSLTVPRRNDGMTETVSQLISVDAAPIEPVINYEVMTLKQGNNVVGAKILFDATKSKGSEIDFTNARWSLPIAGSYGDQPTQIGPTSLYSLIGINENIIVEVALTLSRKSGTDPITITKLINIKSGELPESKLVVTRNIEDSSEGKVVILDVLKSSGPNIDWEKTDWLIDGQYSRKGAVVRIDVPASSEKKIINYVCTMYRYGAEPQVEKGSVEIKATGILPIISYRRLSSTQNNIFELSVLDTKGVNIDWEKTDWYIYDGNENVVQKKGAKVAHAFTLNSEQMGYPIMVAMYLKGSSMPCINYASIDVEGDELIPIITYGVAEDDPGTITFIASNSKGSNIDWNNTKWTFGDSSESQYGAVVTKKYPVSGTNMKYRVTLTLTRRSTNNGSTEIKVGTKDITIGKDELKAVIKAEVKGDYIILSAEQSKGKGLLLDRSVWAFAGSMNSESFTKSTEDGVIKRTMVNESNKNSLSIGFNTQIGVMSQQYSAGNSFFSMSNSLPQFYISALANFGTQTNNEIDKIDAYQKVDSSDYKNFNETFTNSDSHMGAICRRLIKDKNGKKLSNICVSLFVYRMLTDGSMEGESITVSINVKEATGSKIYE